MIKTINIAIILTVYNRKDVTLKGLEYLYKTIKKSSFNCDVFMTDDNSTDGTSEAVKSKFPDVNILKGNGSLFWGGGMNYAWNVAAKTKNYDYYIWFNDDSFLFDNAINILLDPIDEVGEDSIICGAFCDSIDNKKATYGGRLLNNGPFLTPNGTVQEFKYLNGNLVLIPQKVFQKLGYIDSHFRHSMGDYDYGLRALNEGVKLFLAKEFVGICNRHDSNVPKCYNRTLSLRQRLKAINYPVGPDFRARVLYVYRHQGLLPSCLMGGAIILKTIFPLLYKNNRI